MPWGERARLFSESGPLWRKMTVMKALWLSIVLSWFLVDAPAVRAQEETEGAAAGDMQFGWISSWEKARAEALRLDKPLMVVLRCGP